MSDQSVQERFEEVDTKIAATDKRVDEVKWYIGGIGGLFSIWFAVLTLVLSWNYSADKASLRDFQRDLRADLGKSVGLPELELIGIDGNDLEGQELEATFQTQKTDDNMSNTNMILNFGLKNSGDESTGPITATLYTDNSIAGGRPSIDEHDFKYAWVWGSKYSDPPEIPGRLTLAWRFTATLASSELPPAGKHPALIKFFYGKGKAKRAKITIRIPQHP